MAWGLSDEPEHVIACLLCGIPVPQAYLCVISSLGIIAAKRFVNRRYAFVLLVAVLFIIHQGTACYLIFIGILYAQTFYRLCLWLLGMVNSFRCGYLSQFDGSLPRSQYGKYSDQSICLLAGNSYCPLLSVY